MSTQSVSFNLSGKVMIVTGASRGIGRAIAIAAAEHGADLILGNRKVAETGDTADACRALGVRVEVLPLDAADLGSIDAFIDAAWNAFGKVDILVNNAGVNYPMPAWDVDESTFDTIVDLNLKGNFFLSTRLARRMAGAEVPGRIINITSQAGVVGAPLRGPYSAAKAGVNHLSKTLAAEWASKEITVNAVAPTFTRTPLLEEALKNPEFAANIEKIPMGRIAEPEEIAGAVIFLASDAARMITGQTIAVDGGFTTV